MIGLASLTGGTGVSWSLGFAGDNGQERGKGCDRQRPGGEQLHEPRPFCFFLDAASAADGEHSAGCAGGGAALAGGFVEDDGSGGGDVEGTDAAGHGDAQQVVAGAADQVVEAGAFAAEDEDTVAGEVELVVVGGAAFVEADDPDVLLASALRGRGRG